MAVSPLLAVPPGSGVDSAGSPGRPEMGELPELAALVERCRFPEAATVDVAVSGGPDSMALVILALAAGRVVRAHHVDHGLRPSSGAEAEEVGRVVRALGASYASRRVEVGPGPNLEARARSCRYQVLPADVLTGHTADDQAETVLLNVLRGAALDGLAPMTAPGRVGRPLLGLRRADTRRVCRVAGVAPFHDPSNDDMAFRRNAVRHRVLPLLAELSGRDPVPVLARQATLLADDAALLDHLAAGLDPTDARTLAAAPPALARRAVRAWLRRRSDAERHPPTSAEVERVLTVARGDAVATEVAGGRRVRRSRGVLVLEDPRPAGSGAGGPRP